MKNLIEEEISKFKTKQFPLTKEEKKEINSLFKAYIFFTHNKDGISFQTTCCHKQFDERIEAIAANHNDKGICPYCKRQVTYKDTKKVRKGKNLFESFNIARIRVVNQNKVYIICTYARKVYENIHDPQVEISNFNPYIYVITPKTGIKLRKQYNGNYSYEKSIMEPFYISIAGYEGYDTIGMHKLEKTFLKYSGYREWMNNRGSNFYICKYLTLYPTHPQFEMMAKFGMYSIIKSAVVDSKENKSIINWSGTTPQEIFGISKDDFNQLLNSKEQITQYGNDNYLKVLKILKAARRINQNISVKTAIEYVKFDDNFLVYKLLCSHKYRADLKKVVNYLNKTVERAKREINCCSNYLGDDYIYRTYFDYVMLADRIGLDLSQDTVAFPKDLVAAHQNVIDINNTLIAERQSAEEKRKNKENAQSAKKLYKKRKQKFEYSDDTFTVIVPETLEEIIKEGQALHHCVASYVERHAQGKSTILFLRAKDMRDKSLYTIEYNEKTKKEIQIQGFKNCTPLTPEAKAFHSKWIEHVHKMEENEEQRRKAKKQRKEQQESESRPKKIA